MKLPLLWWRLTWFSMLVPAVPGTVGAAALPGQRMAGLACHSLHACTPACSTFQYHAVLYGSAPLKPPWAPAASSRLLPQHYAASSPAGRSTSAEHLDITFTATTSASGTLLLGSSREEGEWGTGRQAAVEEAILARAALFLPALQGLGPKASATRVGLRPYALGGLPLLGPAEGLPGGLQRCCACWPCCGAVLLSAYVFSHR
jgi:hypothetical protein